jgi:Calcium binding
VSTETFKPGDRVVWWKQTPGGDYVFPVLSTVLAVTAKRIKIEAEDEEGKVIRHVLPRSIEHHASPPKSGGKPSPGYKPGRSKRPGKETGAAQSKRSGLSVVRWGRAASPEKDEDREYRIMMEIVVDAYGEEERALGWYYYLQEKLVVPFLARCVEEREVSPLSVGDEVEVVGMPPERECEREMFVSIRWGHRKLAVPLAQLEVVDADDETWEAVEDWLYWVGRGYQF